MVINVSIIFIDHIRSKLLASDRFIIADRRCFEQRLLPLAKYDYLNHPMLIVRVYDNNLKFTRRKALT